MEIYDYKTYYALTDLIQECVESARDESCKSVYIKNIDSAKINHIVDVFEDSCNLNQIRPIYHSVIPFSCITPDRVCGLSFQCYTDFEVNCMTLTLL